MLPGGQPFEHWSCRFVGDADHAAACDALLERLQAQGQLIAPRARLYRPSSPAGPRQALWLDFGAPLALAGQDRADLGLWLVEQADGKVSCYGVERPTRRHTIGGRVHHDLAVLQPDAPWVSTLAERLAARTLAATSFDQPPARHLLEQVERSLISAALATFCAKLDPGVLAVVRAEGRATPALFNAYCAGAQSARRNRVQAAQAFPWFADVLREDWRLRRGVDRGEPLAKMLAARFQVRPSTLARTRLLSPPPAPLATRLALLKQLDALPPEYHPHRETDWMRCLALGEQLHALASALDVEPLRLLKPFRSGWRAGLTDLARRSGAPLDPDSIFEMMQATYEYGVRPALIAWRAEAGSTLPDLPRRAPAGFYPLWFGRYGLERLAGLAQHWRQGLTRATLARLQVDLETREPLAWPAQLPGVATRGPYRILELTSQSALELEGHRLGHCVGTYAATCLTESCSIYAIRDRLGHPLSTFEVRWSDDGPVLIQHKALANSQPAAAEQALVARFILRVLAALPPTRVAAVHAQRQAIAAEALDLIERLTELEHDGTLADEVQEDIADDLARLTDALHPGGARRDGIVPYLHQRGQALLMDLLPDGSPRRAR